jgi:hypothetical protein
MSIKSVMINCVESQYTQEYIANVFWRQCIAKVSSITLIPYLKNGCVYNIAYITIDEWCASENAYNFIKRLNDQTKETRIVHHDDEWWPVEINTHNNGDMDVGVYTTVFTPDYFERKEFETADSDEEETVVDDEESEEIRRQHPIQGLYDDRYTHEEAEAHLQKLKQDLSRAYRCQVPDEALEELEYEISHFESELSIHRSVENSKNVTLREHQKFRWAAIHPEDSCRLREVSWNDI